MFCLRCFQVPCLFVAELSFKSISLLKITRKEGNFQDLRHKFRTCLFAPHSFAIMVRRAGQIFNPTRRFFRCIFMQVHWILHHRSANPHTLLFIVSWKWRIGHQKTIGTGGELENSRNYCSKRPSFCRRLHKRTSRVPFQQASGSDKTALMKTTNSSQILWSPLRHRCEREQPHIVIWALLNSYLLLWSAAYFVLTLAGMHT